MRPYATTTETSGSSSRTAAMNASPRGFSGCSTGMPSLSAARFTGEGSTCERERPRGLSGCVTTPTTS